MLCYLYKNVLKNCVNASLKTRPLCSYSEKVRADIIARKYRSFESIFKSYGFSETQVYVLLSKRPSLLYMDKDGHIIPKLEFFREKGFSSSDLCHILGLDPEIMRRNMYNLIIPSFEFLRSVLKDDASVIYAVRRCTWLLKLDLGKFLRPNIELLRSYGVPNDRIAAMLRLHPRGMLLNADGFRMVVEEVTEMGFEPVKSQFVKACQVKLGLSETMWKRKWDCFKKWGWSDDEIRSAFMKQPSIMAVSEKKVEKVMEFLVNKMRWEISKVASCPAVIMHSLENWTKPRCLLIQFLLSKGAIKKDFPLSTVIVSIESRFVKNYVKKYCAEFPEVLELYASLSLQKNTQAAGQVSL
ncbi:hypothetical protein DCAR_0100589 [Daucus carota subsp. sativus]|uniref:Uncharacterized protein n=1 Tax=Daucus carota subsp. sativus TaxID=79200 RepID=A0AAF0W0U1_DAUCS|nr:PREDICTED: uncharacterized protein LOC108205122 isoform X1 [Daucus carota subsp. sativus]XP_017230412.1 PREDICTED: uncharacterized protein LOC108205122 isoform X1 [Daucus carota subsp. sativus]WOG81442.1 hypothetical protein DCAR_0100589 [Daucus carota subsp. sativus]